MPTASTWLARSRTPRHAEQAHHAAAVPSQPGLFARLRHRIGEHRRQRAEGLVAGLIERNGGHITDGVEREIVARSLRH